MAERDREKKEREGRELGRERWEKEVDRGRERQKRNEIERICEKGFLVVTLAVATFSLKLRLFPFFLNLFH